MERRRLKRTLAVALTSVSIPVVVAAAVLVARYLGVVQSPELLTYDLFMRWRWNRPEPISVAAIVQITERDTSIRYPLRDEDLITLLKRVLACQPRAIGIDIYRSNPVPPGDSAELDRILLENPNVIVIAPLGQKGDVGGPVALSVLRDQDDRVGFNDFPEDIDGCVRRALVFAESPSGENVPSFAFLLARSFLEQEGIEQTTDGLALGKWRLTEIRAHDGPYAMRGEAGGYQFFLDGPQQGAFATVALQDVLSGSFDPSWFRQKVVLVGYTDKLLKDIARTPTGKRMGVELHASVVEQLVRMARGSSHALRALPQMQVAVYVLIWSIVGGGIGAGFRSLRQLIVLVIGAWLAIGTIGIVAFNSGLFISVVPPMIACTTSAVLVTAYQYYREREDRRTLQHLVHVHLSEKVVRTIWAQRDALLENGRLVARQMPGTVLFTDLRSFSSIAEGMKPDELMAWLNEYFESICGVVENPGDGIPGGIINKFNGDQIVALFGPPIERDRDGMRADANAAVECALRMRAKFEVLNVDWRARGLPTTQMRVGIHTGPLVAGSLGSRQRLEYTVIGDTVNIASRLESFDKDLMSDDLAAGGCRILISETTRSLLADGMQVRPLGEHPLTGKKQTIGVYAVLGYGTGKRAPAPRQEASSGSAVS
jgi:adenylate cyclase